MPARRPPEAPFPLPDAGLPCRVLPHEVAGGPLNMARDEALLDAAADDPSSAFLRTYGWSEPTLSLGYFQPFARLDAEARWRGVPVVRRPTGGGAIWHDHELTYALAVPRAHPLAACPETLYRAVHEAIVALLAAEGVDSRLRGPAEGPVGENRPLLCFTDRSPEDILRDGAKVVGSSQRRRRGAVLQHGSLLLRRSAATPELPGIADLAPVPADAGFWSDRIRERLPVALGLRPRPHDWTPADRGQAEVRVRTTYGNESWTRRR